MQIHDDGQTRQWTDTQEIWMKDITLFKIPYAASRAEHSGRAGHKKYMCIYMYLQECVGLAT